MTPRDRGTFAWYEWWKDQQEPQGQPVPTRKAAAFWAFVCGCFAVLVALVAWLAGWI